MSTIIRLNQKGVAWEEQDSDKICALFTSDGVYKEKPGKLMRGINTGFGGGTGGKKDWARADKKRTEPWEGPKQ